MRNALGALAALTLSACSMSEPADASARSAAPEPAGAAAAQPAADCPLLVRFGSFAMGVDAPAVQAVEQALRADARTASVAVRPWGREGERDLCVTPRDGPDAAQLVKTARGALPARKLNGYVEILLDGKRVFTTQT